MPTTVFFASNRILTGAPDELNSYGPNIQPPSISTGITYGTAFVDGIDVASNTQGTVSSIQNTKAGSFQQGVADDLSQAGRNLLVFIHGFDNTFSDALTPGGVQSGMARRIRCPGPRHHSRRVELAVARADRRPPSLG